MNEIEQYLQNSNEIIGDRTKEEELYDKEVIKYLKKYGKIRKALNKANKNYPNEAMKYDDTNINDITAHYEYLMQHSEIVNKLGH
jgi:DNA-binding protein H-NS